MNHPASPDSPDERDDDLPATERMTPSQPGPGSDRPEPGPGSDQPEPAPDSGPSEREQPSHADPDPIPDGYEPV